MSEIDRKINQGFIYIRSCTSNVECGNQHTAKAFLEMAKTIINDYPKQAECLKPKYNEAKKLYDTKFGSGLEKDLE